MSLLVVINGPVANAGSMPYLSKTIGINVPISEATTITLNKAIESLRKANSLDKNNPRILAQLTSAYSYFSQKDSAFKYLNLTDKIDPKAIHPEVRKLLKQK